MKIKGVTGGKMKGNPIEYQPNEKPPFAVKDAVSKASPSGELWYAEKITVSKQSHQTNGPREDKKPFANNTYFADGEVVIRRLILKSDKLKPVEKKKFKIEFADCCDDFGMPDLVVNKFELT